MGIRRLFVCLFVSAVVTGCNGCEDDDPPAPVLAAAPILDANRQPDGETLVVTDFRYPASEEELEEGTGLVPEGEPEGECSVDNIVAHLTPLQPGSVANGGVTLSTRVEFDYFGSGGDHEDLFDARVLRRELYVVVGAGDVKHAKLQEERSSAPFFLKEELECDHQGRVPPQDPPRYITDFGGAEDLAKLRSLVPAGTNPGRTVRAQIHVVFEVYTHGTVVRGAYHRVFEFKLAGAAPDWEVDEPKSSRRGVQ